MNAEIEPLLTTLQIAHLLHLDASSLSRYRATGNGPKYYPLTPRTPRYRASDVEEWLARISGDKEKTE